MTAALDLDRAYEVMTLARHLDERMWRLARSGRAHFAVPCAGHEGIGTAYGLALRAGHDFVAPHYRDLPAMLALGLTPREIGLHFFARRDDPCAGGRQPYAHWGSRRLGIISQQGPQPNQVTHGVGVAWGSKLLGTDQVTWIGFGDGGAQKGEVHEAMNIAAIHRLPCVFCAENNGYTQSVPSRLESATFDIGARAGGYGIPGVVVDAMDVVAMYEVAEAAIARARAGEGPTYIDARCYRFLPNTSNDDDTRYRSPAEVEEARKRDPLLLLRARLEPVRANVLDEEAMTVAAEALEWAEEQPEGDPELVYEHTYS
ncbi:MAG TPA: thiamine pyrophosphate-dependent dehydrogenase E1 component subunit alpha [Candidatus Dormibacteraeota bacterium]